MPAPGAREVRVVHTRSHRLYLPATILALFATAVRGAVPAPPPLDSSAAWRTAQVDGEEQSAEEGPTENRPVPAPTDRAAGAAVPADGAGEAAFLRSCTECHDAQRSLSKRKSPAGWRATVRRMAAKSGADIPPSDWDAIAAYLASQTGGDAATAAAAANGGAAADEPSPTFALNAAVAPLWRGGNDRIENPGFFPDTWILASWQGQGPLSARATACITCHGEAGQSDRVALAEAALRLDLAPFLPPCSAATSLSVDAGRFIVPFGAYAAQSNPGAQRAVTKPLMFNMGQNVRRAEIGNPVLPMPYADEGVDVALGVAVWGDLTATLDAYAVNGLEGASSGIDFFASRDYVDNNFDPAVGGRLTLGNKWLRLGSSVMGGRFNVEAGSGPAASELDYQIWGVDVVARHEDQWRVQAEYARRDSDRVVQLPGRLLATEQVDGWYVEGEWRISCQPRVSVLVRFDGQDRNGPLPPAGSPLASGVYGVQRFTYGLNVTLPGGSLLMIDHERWFLPGNLERIDVLGLRWVAAF